MNWVVSSLIMFTSSVGLYLFVRKAALAKVSPQYNNLAMFFIPLFLFFSMGILTHQNFLLEPYQYFMIVFIAVVFSYLGNVFSLISIASAPNPGYSLMISKSYVVFTTLVSVLFFNAEITVRKVIAIVLIVSFSSLIMLTQKQVKLSSDKKWLPLAFGSFFCWGLLSLSSKYLFTQGVNVYVFLTYTYCIVTVCIVLEMMKRKVNFSSIKSHLWIFLLIGFFSTGFNLFQFLAIQTAPNVGYVNAINASSISAVTLCAILLFKDEFSKRKFIGILGVTVGLLILLL